jgi:general secretion pathway protein D
MAEPVTVTTGDFDVGNLAAPWRRPRPVPGLGRRRRRPEHDRDPQCPEEQQNANILSTPSLLTLDNEEAYITVGQQVPFITGSFTNTGANNGAQNPFQTIERQSVGITLTVTPQINEGDSVVLDIEQEVNSLTGATLPASAAAADLITNERKAADQGAGRGRPRRRPRRPDQGRRAEHAAARADAR